MKVMLVACTLVVGVASAWNAVAETSPQSVDAARLGQAAAKMMPLGYALETAAQDDPLWPIAETPDALNATQLACVRSNLRQPQFQAMMEKRAKDYVRDNPARAADDLKLLEGGGGQLFARMVTEGIKSERNNANASTKVDMTALMLGSKPDDIAGMMALASDPQNQPLRVLIGFDQSITDSDSGKEAGQSAAMTFMMPMLMNAMTTCNVPASALLK